MSVQWRDEMAVDHGVIDHDHQTLIAIINSFCNAKPSDEALFELNAILDRLEHYTAEHFAREETLQKHIQYTFADAHHHEHIDLIRQLGDIRGRLSAMIAPQATADAEDPIAVDAGVAESLPPAGAVATFHAEMADFLHHWLVDHIIKSDLRMKPFAAKIQEHSPGLRGLADLAPEWRAGRHV